MIFKVLKDDKSMDIKEEQLLKSPLILIRLEVSEPYRFIEVSEMQFENIYLISLVSLVIIFEKSKEFNDLQS